MEGGTQHHRWEHREEKPRGQLLGRGEQQGNAPRQAEQGWALGWGRQGLRLEPCTGLGFPLQASPELGTSRPAEPRRDSGGKDLRAPQQPGRTPSS